MKTVCYLILILCCTNLIQAQEVYVSDNNGSIYTLDLENCATSFIVDIDNNLEPNDITFHPNGNLYGIGSNGNLYEIDILDGTTNLLTDFDGQNFNSLTCDENGLFYATGNQGVLWTYDLVTDIQTNLGDFNFDATGDLTFFEGSLFAAVQGDNIVQIDLDNISNSSIVINESVTGNVFGIVSFSEGCSDFNTFANASNGDIYLIDFANEELDFICSVNLTIYGGASTFEFLASAEPIVIDSINIVSPTCNTTGEIEIIASGGTAPIEFSLNGGAFQTSGIFNDLDAGIYEIALKDEADCTVLDTINFEIPDLPFIDGISFVEIPNCGVGDFSIEVMATGEGLEYALNGGGFQSTNLFEDLDTGTYEIALKDENDCIVLDTAILEIPDLPFINDIVVDTPDCGIGGFSLDVMAIGDDLEYSLNGGTFQNSNLFNDLDDGTYEVAIQDENNCVVLDTVILMEVDLPVIDSVVLNPPLCDGDAFDISIFASGGTDGLVYSTDGINFEDNNVFSINSSGDYTAYVQDALDCETVMDFELIDPPTFVFGDFLIEPTICNQNNGSISIDVNGIVGGAFPYQFSIDNGVAYQNDNLFEGLTAGNYVLTIKDANDCLHNSDFFIPQSETLMIQFETIEASCEMANGSITLMPQNATGQMTYSLDGGILQTENRFENLPSGTYSILAEDEQDCSVTIEANILEKEAVIIDLANSQNTDCDKANGFIQVEAMFGIPPYTYSINEIDFQMTSSFNNLAEGTYNVTVKDASDCTAVLTEVNILSNDCQIIVPDAFSPNGDGFNDVFLAIVPNDINASINTFRVYNRWGLLVYQGSNIESNSIHASWDGTYKNKDQEMGVYLYYIELGYSDGSNEILKGNVTLIR